MSNSQEKSEKLKYRPLLPKMKNFGSSVAAGEWTIGEKSLFRDIADNLDFDTAKYTEINSIPSPWSKSLQFMSAIQETNYPSRDWLIAQYRGLLAAIALSENLGLSLQAVRVDLEFYRNVDKERDPSLYKKIEFGRCLGKLKPSDDYTALSMIPPSGSWSQLFLFELGENVIGFTSPATLVVPVGYLKIDIERRIPWVRNGFFVDPIANGLNTTQKPLLASWLNNLRTELMRNPVNIDLAGSIANELEKFRTDLGISQLDVFKPCDKAIPFGEPLTLSPLDALAPVERVTEESNVMVKVSAGLKPARQLYLFDPIKLPALMGRDAREITVIDSSSLANFNRDLHGRSDALFLTDAELFTENLFYARIKGLLPGTWLDKKLNLDNLTILLPLNPILKDYFSSEDLEKNVQLTSCNAPEGPGVRVTLGLQLSGFDKKTVDYQVYKDFPLKAENEMLLAFPELSLWPNIPPNRWREYFVFVDVTEDLGGLAFSIEQPTEKATQEIRESGQEKFQYWKCERYPSILSAINRDKQFLGFLPLTIPKIQAGGAGSWTVGVDFGTSFTNIYVREGNGKADRINLRSHLLRIAKGGLEESQTALIYQEFFIPDVFLPRGENPPLSSILTTRGWQEIQGKIPDLISHARTYFPQEQYDFNKDYIKTNIKWQQVEYQRPFLGQLLRLIVAQASIEGVNTIDWVVSYPSAFSLMKLNLYERTWQNLLKSLSELSEQTHRINGKSYSQGTESENPAVQGLRTESIAFAQFFADILNKNLVHTTCVDIGGGTSDISIWQENTLVHQASVPYAGRNMFHRILRDNLAFVGDIFGLSVQDSDDFRSEFKTVSNFNSALDLYLRANANEILTDGYVMSSNKPRNREFRTLVALAWGGLYHYLGLLHKYLQHPSEKLLLQTENVTSILVGGNGARFLNWLSPSGRYTANSEINDLLRGILVKSSGLQPYPDLMTLSTKPKEEACGGLSVLPSTTKLKGLSQKQKDYPFWGESCTINGKDFAPEDRLMLLDTWQTIDDFRITSFTELENYISNFNKIIADESIEEIDQLRDFHQGGLFQMKDSIKRLLTDSVRDACIKKHGPIAEFEPEPAFLLTLRCFIGVLADQWSKTAN
jgi:hypothetical protein